MDQEQLIREIMAQVMAKVGSPSAAPAPAGGQVSKGQYPLGEKIPEQIKSATGRPLPDFSLEGVVSGTLTAEDFRIAPETLEMQAQVADSVNRGAFARNLRRAAELIAVPDEELLSIYNALRPYRSTKAELYAIADKLENQYGCKINPAFIREAADVYEQRGRLRAE
ncbi:MAG: diol dehydratase small subunit [Propionibacteriaceae bacterium]|jgi:propanediol dehydratase small subunit|nr:diol dehydratase small subunit [Propionibacteriaceae bacterium]